MPPKSKKPLTALAKIHDHPGNWGKDRLNNSILTKFPELKSGVTPSFLKDNAKKSERQDHERLDNYQRTRFRGQ